MIMNIKNITNQRFGRLIALKPTKKRSYGNVIWKCQCDCGKICTIAAGSLLYRGTKSCGCISKERAIRIGKRNKFNINNPNYKHGYSHTKEFHTWWDMNHRCHNYKATNYKDYGGRGIQVYKPWIHSFETFLQYLKDNDMYPKPKNMSIDRIDNDGNYEPGNIKWSTQKEQTNNRRKKNI
jgi:hypothetical protein